jgi:hypothetical protein
MMARQAQSPRQTAPHAPRPEAAGFKPVALPALAAALRQTRAPARETRVQDLPVILRKDSFLA